MWCLFYAKKYRHPTFSNLVQGVGPMSKPRLNDYFVVKLKILKVSFLFYFFGLFYYGSVLFLQLTMPRYSSETSMAALYPRTCDVPHSFNISWRDKLGEEVACGQKISGVFRVLERRSSDQSHHAFVIQSLWD